MIKLKRGDVLCDQARLTGMLGNFNYQKERNTETNLPEVHVYFNTVYFKPHRDNAQCWCEPEIEFQTDFVTVYRHRERM